MEFKYIKKELRCEVSNQRRLCSKKFVYAKSLIISKKLISLLKLKKCKNIVSYMPINNEVDPNLFLFNGSFNVFFTKMRGGNLLISKSKSFKKQKFSILEPFCGTFVFKKHIDCFIVPGIVFSENGYRIGYGLGFYDRLLSKSKALKVGVGFDFQLKNNSAFAEKHDIAVDYLITEKKFFRCRR